MSTSGAAPAAMPWLFAAASPRFSGLAMTRTHGAVCRMASTVPSVEPLSTTTASQGTDGGFVRRASRQSRTMSPEFQVTITTDKHGAGAGDLAWALVGL